jgi:PAS domain S-box-containing protein
MASREYSAESSQFFFADSLICLSGLLFIFLLSLFGIFDEGDLSYWNRFKWEIIVAISLLIAEALLIVGLIVQRDRRRQIEKGLHDIEGKYGTLIETTDTGYVMLDGIGNVLEANSEYVRLTGHSSLDQIAGRRVIEWTAPYDVMRNIEQLENCMRLGYVSGMELDFIHPDGQIVPLEINAALVKNGEDVQIMGLCRDITKRKRVEEQVSLLQTIMLDIGQAMDFSSALEVVLRCVCEETGWVLGQAWIPRQDGTKIECNDAWFATGADLERFRIASEAFAFSPGIGLPGRVWLSKQPLWLEDVTLDENFPPKKIAQQVGFKAALAIPILSGDEVITVLEFFLRKPRLEDESLVKVISTVAGQLNLVIERKRAEEALRDNEERLRLATWSAGLGVFEWDMMSNRAVWENDRIYEIFGHPREEGPIDMAQFLKRYLNPDESGEFEMALSAGMEHGQIFHTVNRFQRRDGEVRWIEITGNFNFTDDGRPQRLIGVVGDITERKLAEEELMESHVRIKDRARKLIVAQEEERKLIARELHDDLNQQVAALAIGLGRLNRQLSSYDTAIQTQLTKLEDRTTRLSDEIRRISHELHSSTLEHVGLEEALKLFCSEFSDQQEISITLSIEEGLGIIPSDVSLCLYRVVQESLRNIARHSGTKHADLELSRSGEFIQLRVADQGVGFDPLISGRRGLGLISMEERVKFLQGSLDLKSLPGVGTELKARIPFRC